MLILRTLKSSLCSWLMYLCVVGPFSEPLEGKWEQKHSPSDFSKTVERRLFRC